MAYQARPRDPFLDSDMQAAIEKRGKELFGFGLLAVGVMVTMLLLSYVPEDPSWMSATDEPAKNWLGRFGAYLASPLFIIVGFGAWAIPFVTVVWGLRFVMHRGEERAVGRLIFAPLAIALASVYASTHVPVSEWTHSFGLGGLFGDTVLGAILGVAPISATFGLKVLAFLVFFGLLFLSLFVLGFDRSEIKAVARFMLVGVILTYASIMKLIGSTGKGAVLAASKANEIRVQRKEARLSAVEESYQDDVPIPGPSLRRAPVVHAPQPLAAPQIEVEKPAAKPSLLARLPGLKPRDVEPELYDEPAIIHDDVDPEDRIKSKISDVIKNRGRRTKPLEYTDEPSMRAEPQLTRGRGPEPLRIDPAIRETAEQHYVDEDELIEPVSAAPALTRVNAPLTKPVVQQPVRKPVAPSKRAVAEAQPALQFEDNSSDFELPPLNLLTSASTVERHVLSDEALEENAR
ncbi:DNA translocase FtsK, partial [Litoreibacter halocynthiae]|uniref:DNA translocase FtsK n=1 Tax=Litoreibacter halocynthiae TaxID=1242689 RepID=UPI0024902892